MDYFVGQWETEISLDELDKFTSVSKFTLDGLSLIRTFGISDMLRILEEEKWDDSKLPDYSGRIISYKEKFITIDSLFLYELAKKQDRKFRILYKDLTPGSTTISYSVRVVFE